MEPLTELLYANWALGRLCKSGDLVGCSNGDEQDPANIFITSYDCAKKEEESC